MSYPVRCPHCDDHFKVHGYETWIVCRVCNNRFNVQTNGIHELQEADDYLNND